MTIPDPITVAATSIMQNLMSKGLSQVAGDPLKRALASAISETCSLTSDQLSPDACPANRDAVDSAIRRYLLEPALVQLVLEAALARLARRDQGGVDGATTNNLQSLMREAGFEPETLPGKITVNEIVQRFVTNLAAALDDKARDYNSALANLVDAIRTRATLDELRPLLTTAELRDGCSAVTAPRLERFLGLPVLVPRASTLQVVESWMGSSFALAAVVGPTGAGKATALAAAAQKYAGAGWAVLLVPAIEFDLETAANDIVRGGLGRTLTPDWRSVFVSPWGRGAMDQQAGFLLVLPGLDRAPDSIATEIGNLLLTCRTSGATSVKVLVSCNQETWDRHWSLRLASVYERAAEIPLDLFSEEELDAGLLEVGDRHLLVHREPGLPPDPYVAAVRRILRHADAFAYYSESRQSRRGANNELSWTGLVSTHAERMLQHSQSRCGVYWEDLRDRLVALLGRRGNGPPGRTLELPDVQRALAAAPTSASVGAVTSPYEALLEVGLIEEIRLPNGQRVVQIGAYELEAYLYSFVLQREAGPDSSYEFYMRVGSRISENFQYRPSIDGLLLWLGRLSDEEVERQQAETLVRALVVHEFVQIEVAFSRLPSRAVNHILRTLANQGEREAYQYRRALEALPPFPEVLLALDRRLSDRRPHVRQVAARVCGSMMNIEAIPKLIDLLADDADEVRTSALEALSDLGVVAIHDVAESAADSRRPAAVRVACLGCLRGIGIMTNEVSAAISACLADGRDGDGDLQFAGLTAAAYFRDPEQVHFALVPLGQPNENVALAAARLLINVPTASAEYAIREGIDRWRTFQDLPLRTLVLTRLYEALAVCGGKAGEEVALAAIRRALHDD